MRSVTTLGCRSREETGGKDKFAINGIQCGIDYEKADCVECLDKMHVDGIGSWRS